MNTVFKIGDMSLFSIESSSPAQACFPVDGVIRVIFSAWRIESFSFGLTDRRLQSEALHQIWVGNKRRAINDSVSPPLGDRRFTAHP